MVAFGKPRDKREEQRIQDEYEAGHDWFAWRPVLATDGTYVWLETVTRLHWVHALPHEFCSVWDMWVYRKKEKTT